MARSSEPPIYADERGFKKGIRTQRRTPDASFSSVIQSASIGGCILWLRPAGRAVLSVVSLRSQYAGARPTLAPAFFTAWTTSPALAARRRASDAMVTN